MQVGIEAGPGLGIPKGPLKASQITPLHLLSSTTPLPSQLLPFCKPEAKEFAFLITSENKRAPVSPKLPPPCKKAELVFKVPPTRGWGALSWLRPPTPSSRQGHWQRLAQSPLQSSAAAAFRKRNCRPQGQLPGVTGSAASQEYPGAAKTHWGPGRGKRGRRGEIWASPVGKAYGRSGSSAPREGEPDGTRSLSAGTLRDQGAPASVTFTAAASSPPVPSRSRSRPAEDGERSPPASPRTHPCPVTPRPPEALPPPQPPPQVSGKERTPPPSFVPSLTIP